jgi:hypothetical protein
MSTQEAQEYDQFILKFESKIGTFHLNRKVVLANKTYLYCFSSFQSSDFHKALCFIIKSGNLYHFCIYGTDLALCVYPYYRKMF